MPRPRYRITAADVRVVHRWVRERLRNDAWLEDWPRFTAWDKFPYEKPTVKTLQRWCDRFLDTKQWKQLQAVIRANRRDPSRYRTVRLSQPWRCDSYVELTLLTTHRPYTPPL